MRVLEAGSDVHVDLPCLICQTDVPGVCDPPAEPDDDGGPAANQERRGNDGELHDDLHPTFVTGNRLLEMPEVAASEQNVTLAEVRQDAGPHGLAKDDEASP